MHFAWSIILVIVIAPLVGKLASSLSILSKRKQSDNNLRTPLLGGISFAASNFVFVHTQSTAITDDPLLVGTLLFTMIGVIDDIIDLRPLKKLVLQILCGIVFIFSFIPNASFIDQAAILLFIVCIVNAFNFIDGADMLATSYALFFMFWLLIIDETNVYASIIAGSCLGFLPYNLPKAKLYLGDSGSHYLGFCISYLYIEHFRTTAIGAGLNSISDILPLLILICDICFVICTRLLRGTPIMTGGSDHILHRLSWLYGRSISVALILGLYVMLILFSLAARHSSTEYQVSLVVLLVIVIIPILVYLAKVTNKYIPQETSP
jgi:UDP-GlcNAc:undecaprenyl-phosphate/decaprenyl-phosphate GlcNAc-1-phosphate transferase